MDSTELRFLSKTGGGAYGLLKIGKRITAKTKVPNVLAQASKIVSDYKKVAVKNHYKVIPNEALAA